MQHSLDSLAARLLPLVSTLLLGSVALGQEPGGLEETTLRELRTHIQTLEYEFTPEDGGRWGAPNRAQGLRTLVTPEGIEIRERRAETPGAKTPWTLRLRTKGFGRGEEIHPVGIGTLAAEGCRASIEFAGLTEWLINDERGIEQGWTVASPPAGEAGDPLCVELTLEGDLALRIDAAARGGVLVDAGGTTRARYTGLRAWDRNDRELEARLVSNARGIAIEIDDRLAAYPVTIDPIISGPAWTWESDQALAQVGISVACAGDVNGDGYSDIICGAHRYDNGETDEGRVFAFYGSAAGFAYTYDWSAESNQEQAEFGTEVACAGDVNGDGYSDVIIGAPRFDDGIGNAFVYHGSVQGLEPTPAWSVITANTFYGQVGEAVSTAGDVNGDGYSDVIVSSPYKAGLPFQGIRTRVYYGGANGLSPYYFWDDFQGQTEDRFGAAVACAGDLDGDGFDDIAITAPKADGTYEEEGAVYVYMGSASGLGSTYTLELMSGKYNTDFGSAVACAGDVNADGYADLLVGAENYDGNHSNEGRVSLFLGSASGLDPTAAWEVTGGQALAYMGAEVAAAGDVNGDGFADVLVPAYGIDYHQTNDGAVYLYLGHPEGLADSPSWTKVGTQYNGVLGTAIAPAGDINGDGYSDLLIGYPTYDGPEDSEGLVYLYLGGADGPRASGDWSRDGESYYAELGLSMAHAGDVDGDGFSDVIVGSPGYEGGEGRAYVYFGGTWGLPYTGTVLSNPTADASWFAASVASAGDVNGDGYDDVIVGAPRHQSPFQHSGVVYVYYGSALGISTTPDWSFEGSQALENLGHSVAGGGDVNGDGFSDVIVGAPYHDSVLAQTGRILVFFGSETGPSTTAAAWSAQVLNEGGWFGYSVAFAGDVDADGYSDIIVGAPHYSDGQDSEGKVFLYLGREDGPFPTPTWSYESNLPGAHFGYCVAAAGDVNGDYHADVLVGMPDAPFESEVRGYAYLFYGDSGGLPGAPGWVRTDALAGARYGSSLAGAGDVNGDGYADVVIGSHLADIPMMDSGRAYVYLGSGSGLSADPWVTSELPQAFAHHGRCVTGAGDVNGDGYADLLIAAPYHDDDFNGGGRVTSYLGNGANGGYYEGIRQRRCDDSAPVAMLGTAVDYQRIRLEAALRRTIAGLEHWAPGPIRVYLEWSARPLGVAYDDGDEVRGVIGVDSTALNLPHELSEVAGNLEPGRPYHWRMRFAFDGSPLLANTPWVSLPGNCVTETRFRTPLLGTGTTNDQTGTVGSVTVGP